MNSMRKMAEEYRIVPQGAMIAEACNRFMQELDSAEKIVRKYVQIKEQGIEQTPDGLLRHRAELTALEYMLPEIPLNQRGDAYMWMVAEKHQAQKTEKYERAAILRDSQKTLESRLFPFKDNLSYVAIEEFMKTKGWSEDQVAWEYEKSLLEVWERNRGEVGKVHNDILGTVFVVGLLRRLGSEAKEEFNAYLARTKDSALERMRLKRMYRE